MPRIRTKGLLAKSAAQDLEKHTLSRIPTLYGQLSYLASLRDRNSGAYRHHGLSEQFGREEAVQALKQAHSAIFLEWLNLSIADKYEDLGKYVAGLDVTVKEAAEHWRQTGTPQTLIPQGASEAAREHFLSDLRVLLMGLSYDSGGERQGPDSKPPG
jgi:hypothetical protein